LIEDRANPFVREARALHLRIMSSETPSESQPHLLALSGQAKGQRFTLREEFLIGRHEPTVPVTDMSVSRQHCLIRKQDAGFFLKDLGSHNGTIVNGERVSDRILEHGDQILIGNFEFLFVASEQAIPTISASVQFVDQKVDLTRTISLRAESSTYIRPENALAASVSDDRVRQDLTALLRIARSVNSRESGGSYQGSVMEMILDVIPADGGAILFVAPGGVDAALVAEGFKGQQRFSRTIVDRVLKERTGIMTNHVGLEVDPSPSLVASGVRALVCVPLLVADRTIGAIYLIRTTNDADFDEGHLHLLTAIAAIVSAPLEVARQVERLKLENERLQNDVDAGHQMIGSGKALQDIHRFISRVAKTDSTVLIGGESGTGKELVARAIHRTSNRAQMPFIAVNCAAMTETLVESELFGHEKGAFTGALSQTKGKFETAQGGTIFLDEVGELPLTTQAKLLRVIQEREVNRIGNPRPIKIDVRIIAATNRDLEEEVREGRFRKDLFYRLNVVSITLQPLRNRREDIMLLAEHFLAKANAQCNRQVSGFSPEAAACIIHYEWPGNIRELQNAIERAVVLGVDGTITPEDLPDALIDSVPPNQTPSPSGFHARVRENKIQLIHRALNESGGNHLEAAKLLGLNRTYLHKLIRTFGM
jgi:transcriptional regulator with GAF, ATPase, and Fis domain